VTSALGCNHEAQTEGCEWCGPVPKCTCGLYEGERVFGVKCPAGDGLCEPVTAEPEPSELEP
jgi:hypothetical protein